MRQVVAKISSTSGASGADGGSRQGKLASCTSKRRPVVLTERTLDNDGFEYFTRVRSAVLILRADAETVLGTVDEFIHHRLSFFGAHHTDFVPRCRSSFFAFLNAVAGQRRTTIILRFLPD